jgi:hypothetical protein
LDLPRGALAETVVKALCLLAVLVPFDKATDVLFRLLGVAVSKKRAVTTVAKVSEQAYQQNRRRATQRWEHRQELIANRPPVGQRKGRLFVMVDGTNVGIKQSECFKECKSAVLFWEHDVRPRRRRSKSKRGRPDQHIERRLIVSHIGPHTEFLPYLWDAFVEMGGLSAEYVIWSADGIDWIWDDRQRVLPDDAFTVFELLDWYHLFENIWKAAKVLHDDPADQRRWVNAIKRTMRKRNTGCGLAADLRAIADAETDPEKQRVLSNVADYVYTHRHRMSYADFRYNNWPRGSAAIESVQHGVIQARFKLPGMRWTVDGANRMLRLRNAYFSGRWDEVFGNAFAALKHQLSPQADTPARKAG